MLTDIDDTGTLTVLGKDVAAPTAATDHKVKLTSMKYYAAMMTPLNNPSIPSQVLVPMYEIASSAHQLSAGLTASQLQTISFNVPASTFQDRNRRPGRRCGDGHYYCKEGHGALPFP